MGRLRTSLCLLVFAVLAMAAVGCAQAPATTDFGAPRAPGQIGVPTPEAPVGPTLGTVSVWLREHGILLWTPAVPVAGTYAFEIENRGDAAHDLVIVRAPSVEAVPSRSDRPQLRQVDVVTRSPVLQAGQSTTLLANLEASGPYVVLSSQGRDFGMGMASILTVGAAGGRVAPLPTPPPDDRQAVAAYLVDESIFLHHRQVGAGIVTFNVQNIGPSAHEFVVVQWRGHPTALPVDHEENLLLDSLMVLGRLPAIPPGEAAMLEVELDSDLAYVVLCALPGHYASGMSAQIAPR